MYFQIFDNSNNINIFGTNIFDKSISNINISNIIIFNINIFNISISDASTSNTSIKKKIQINFQVFNYTNTINISTIYKLISD